MAHLVRSLFIVAVFTVVSLWTTHASRGVRTSCANLRDGLEGGCVVKVLDQVRVCSPPPSHHTAKKVSWPRSLYVSALNLLLICPTALTSPLLAGTNDLFFLENASNSAEIFVHV